MNNEDQDIELSQEGLDDSVVEEEYSQDKVKKLKEKLKETEAKVKEYLDGWQRAQADFVNLRKRDEEAKMDFIKFANESLIIDLIPVLDSLDLARAHTSIDSVQVANLEPIQKQLLSILEPRGLEASNPIGEKFDPKFHEAVGVIPTEKKEEDHKILEVLQKGYILAGKIIRPAKVKIGQNNNG